MANMTLARRPAVLSLRERLDLHPGPSGRGVTIAFIDSGYNAHPDLLYPEKRIRTYADVTRDVPLAEDFFSPNAGAWHGTMTACTAAGSGYVSGGRFHGPAKDAEVVLIKACDERSGVTGKHVAAALGFVLRHPNLGVRVVNVSLGVSPDDPHVAEVETALAQVVAKGIVVIAAAGNDPSAPPEAPGRSKHAITVGGLSDNNNEDPSDDTVWASSSHGHDKPDLVAPSVVLPAPMLPGTRQTREAEALFRLLAIEEEREAEARFRGHESDATLLDAIAARIAEEGYLSPEYKEVEGTSFAAPITAGVVAQMLEAAPRLTPAEVRDILVATALPLAKVSRKLQGAGALCPREAVARALARA